jgi:hypothetical protein
MAGVGVNDNTVREGRKPNWITGRVINNAMQWNKRIAVAKNDILGLSLSMHRAFCIVYHLDQSMNNIYINNEFIISYIISKVLNFNK